MRVAKTKISRAILNTYVPPSIRVALKLKGGDVIEWHIENKKVIVKKENSEK